MDTNELPELPHELIYCLSTEYMDKAGDYEMRRQVIPLIQEYASLAAKKERERCARIAEERRDDLRLAAWRGSRDAAAAADSIAAAIREQK